MAKGRKKKTSDFNKKATTPVSKPEDVKFRKLANWWYHFNKENVTILPGRLPKPNISLKLKKRALDETGFKLLVRPPLQIYFVQHPEDLLNSSKKKDIQIKKTFKNPIINSHNEQNDFFNHLLTPEEQLKKYREQHAYSRTRLGKVNKKQLHKASMLLFKSKDSDGKKAEEKSTISSELKKKEISNAIVPHKVASKAKKILTNKTVKSKIKVVKQDEMDSNQEKEKRLEELKKMLSSSKKISSSSRPSSILSTPKRSSRNVSVIPRKKIMSARKRDINQYVVNFPELELGEKRKVLNYNTFGLLPNRPVYHPVYKSYSKRSIAIKTMPSNAYISDHIKEHEINKKLKDSLENDNFLIVRPLAEKPLRVINTEDYKINKSQLLEKHGFPKFEYKYSEKYPGKEKKKKISDKKSKRDIEDILNIDEHVRKGKNVRPFEEYAKEKAAKLEKENEEINKRIRVQTKGVDLCEMSNKLLKRFCQTK